MQIVFDDDPLAFNDRPHGLILLVRGHDEANLRICNAAKAQLLTADGPGIGADEVPTFWNDIRKRKNVNSRHNMSCVELLKFYDYDFARSWISQIDGQCHCLSAEGPSIIAFSDSLSRVFAIDLSIVSDDHRMEKIMKIWNEVITRKPELWYPDDFKVELLRAQFCLYVETIGHIFKL